jgi:hypothetical protein
VSAEIFRDPTEGVSARRADLLRRRRDELVMMPHAIRRVYVARRARTAASLAITLVGAAMLVIAAKPTWTAFLAKGLPGINPAVLCTMTVAMWLVGLFTYFAARAIDEHRFAVAMSKLVMPGKDVNEDVERLSHENPDQAARDMAHRLEVRSATLPILAAAVLLPVTALYAAATIRAHGWPVIAEFEASVAANAMKLIACAGCGVVLALAMTKRATRLPIVAPMAAIVALACIAVSVGIKTLWLVPPALLLGMMALVVRRLRIERDKLQAEDPAAGSEIFTIRGFIRQLRASGAAVIARVKKIRRRKIIIGMSIATAALGGTMMMTKSKQKQTVKAEVTAAMVRKAIQTPTVTPTGSRSAVEPMGDGRLKITLDLADDKPLVIPAINGMSSVPPMWSASVRIEQVEGLELTVSAFGAEDAQPVSIGNAEKSTRSNCGMGPLPLGVSVHGAPGHYVLYVEPVLTPAGCTGTDYE